MAYQQNQNHEFKERTPNHLIHETSPYLLQHAHNPVNWHAWSAEVLEKAKSGNKPILVSIGYSACHWCHVMERESFENTEIAAFMNEHFINIKVDREERPDVDQIYMDAVQAITGAGGWPLNVFLTPDGKPFYGGTYFPPVRTLNRPSWQEILFSIAKTFEEKKEEIVMQAENLTAHLKASNTFGNAAYSGIFEISDADKAFTRIMKSADKEFGGFGNAPKFPQSFVISFLLRYSHIKNNSDALNQALLSLDKMIYGGIYDQLGGGFARYSTDREWLAPHFEKMLYDNALLLCNLSEAWRLTGKVLYKNIIIETLEFIKRELMDPLGGFYSALDADSEGEEGRYYVWDHKEIKEILGNNSKIFSDYYDISERGNWEGMNILRVNKPLHEFATDRDSDIKEIEDIIQKSKKKLLAERAKRIRPSLDDKIILGWNSLMNQAISKAYAATGYEGFRLLAVKNMDFLLSSFSGNGELFYHNWKDGRASLPAFLDDYANLISALIELGQVTADFNYFNKAYQLCQLVIQHYQDESSSFFFYTHKDQQDILFRKKEIYDGATPSGNGVMARNLYHLSLLFDKSEWRKRAESMVQTVLEMVVKYPTSFGSWLTVFFEMVTGTNEIVIIGKEWEKFLEEVLGLFIAHQLVMAAVEPVKMYPFFVGREETRETLIYLCKNYACRQPVNTVGRLINLLESNNFKKVQ